MIGNSNNSYEVGDRVCQIIIMPIPEVEFIEVDKLSDSERGTGGFGSTGNKKIKLINYNNMEVTGKIKVKGETATFGAAGFRKREMVLTTNDQYPQMLKIEFVQDKCDLLNNFQVGQDVKISINLTGREWINPKGEAVYFNAIQGWRVELNANDVAPVSTPTPLATQEEQDLPF